MSTVELKLIHETPSGKLIKSPVTLDIQDKRIWFVKSPFALKDEIKAMEGAKWHGFDEEPIKMWSVANSQRNHFQLAYMAGENVYAWFDRELQRHQYTRPLMDHQKDMSDSGLTYHYQLWAAEMGTGKTLSAQEVVERSGVPYWYWVGPKSSLPNIKREFAKWEFSGTVTTDVPSYVIGGDRPVVFLMTYERLVSLMIDWGEGQVLPNGVIFDESSRLKTWSAKRTRAAFELASKIRETHSTEGYVILMSGTPAPKKPSDYWSQCEICWPGFLREGSEKALTRRLGYIRQEEKDGVTFPKLHGWRDDPCKCNICGDYEEAHNRDYDHKFVPSRNEVAYMYERLQGLALVKLKKDCLTLPEKRYRKVYCEPSKALLRVAKSVVESAQNTVTGLTLLRELSDGFQYRDIEDGTMECNLCFGSGEVDEWVDPDDPDETYESVDMLDADVTSRLEKTRVACPKCGGSGQMKRTKRISKEVPCPKDKALADLLEENEECGRIVVFAGFTGSVDRVVGLCQKNGWDVVRCDGRGFSVFTRYGDQLTDVEPLEYWSDTSNPRVAFVAHPESGGMSLTLTEARMAVYWSNSWKPEYRVQSEDRIHRKGMDENLGCTIVDLIHLPSDERVLEVIQENRKLELMTLGEIASDILQEK